MKTNSWDIHRKGENKFAVYWGIGQTITVREQPSASDANRLLCLTDLKNNCEHVRAVERFLHIPAWRAVA